MPAPTVKTDRTGATVCPKCDRRYYLMDYCLGKLKETIRSERIARVHCDYCQRVVR